MSQSQLYISRYDDYCVFRINQACFFVAYIHRCDPMLRESLASIATNSDRRQGSAVYTIGRVLLFASVSDSFFALPISAISVSLNSIPFTSCETAV